MVLHPTPLDARLRNLTYETEIFTDVHFKISTLKEDGSHEKVREELIEKMPIGKMPVMIKSKYCMTNELSPEELIKAGECFYD